MSFISKYHMFHWSLDGHWFFFFFFQDKYFFVVADNDMRYGEICIITITLLALGNIVIYA